MPLKAKRWNDPVEPDDGYRLLICRYRPRGVRKEDEVWDAWEPSLGPSRDLHADFYGKKGPPIGFAEYRVRYLEEMRTRTEKIRALADRLRGGETITLLCSSACTDAAKCHRALPVTRKRSRSPSLSNSPLSHRFQYRYLWSSSSTRSASPPGQRAARISFLSVRLSQLR